ncbi:hypothetical protein E6C27_scaffold848G00890 [Cucumis melo var. makuwa]|uniref:Uncharacterized protein n=1 Tax=Cucumis melo var. makuwa TaxID=1194695 RepID=A0A5A7SRC4_CUCMM|nr:hypothetical protein E6C27_scaffold848G00890 [Cucumis melo var. makuwa]
MNYSKARLTLFLLLSFALVTLARIILHSENHEAAYMINDYPGPRLHPPPPPRQFEVSIDKGRPIKKNS